MIRIEFKIAILMLWPMFLFGQSADYIIHYDFSCVKDTTTLEQHPLDKYMLYKVGHISRFIHADRYNKDSLTAIFLEENPDPSLSGLPMTQNDVDLFTSRVHEHRAKYNIKIPSDIRVDKNHHQGFLMMYAQHSLPPKWMKESPKLNWKIHSEKEEYRGYTVQLASCSYGGRNYIARFTPQIPINDGPFVFSGLPGLIVSVEDDKGWYGFEISASRLKKTAVYFKNDFYGKKPQILGHGDFVNWMYKEMTNPEIPMGLLGGLEKLKLRLIEKRKDRFDLLIIR